MGFIAAGLCNGSARSGRRRREPGRSFGVPWPGIRDAGLSLQGGGYACSHFWWLLALTLPVRILLRCFCCWRVCLAKQAWYLLKGPAKLALSSLDVSSCCWLGELEPFGWENFACV